MVRASDLGKEDTLQCSGRHVVVYVAPQWTDIDEAYTLHGTELQIVSHAVGRKLTCGNFLVIDNGSYTDHFALGPDV